MAGLCFFETALAFRAHQISVETYFDNMLAHFRGVQHPSDTNDQRDYFLVSRSNDHLNLAMKACIIAEGFEILPGLTTRTTGC
jgi:hypothetical protein